MCVEWVYIVYEVYVVVYLVCGYILRVRAWLYIIRLKMAKNLLEIVFRCCLHTDDGCLDAIFATPYPLFLRFLVKS